MGKQKQVAVGGNEVRQWAAGQAEFSGAKFLTPKEGEKFARGRLPKAVIEAYEKANKGKVYQSGVKPEATVTLTLRSQDKNGRNRSRKVEVSLDRARELAGEAAGKRGVLSQTAIEAASVALSAEAAQS